MTRRVCHMLAAVAVAFLLASCSGKPRIIPRAVLTDIYADMFLADAWLTDHSSENKRADTSLFYDPIFARYGYTFEDYEASVDYYLKDPEKFAKVFRNAASKLRKDRDRYDRIVAQIRAAKEFNKIFKGYSVLDFDSDTLLWKPPVTDSLILDSLRRVAAERDSILRAGFVRDSLVRDSLRLDSLQRELHRNDSILKRQMKAPGPIEMTPIKKRQTNINK